MNREIKFRGLRTDGQGWVYGYYYSWKHFNGKGYEDSFCIEIPNDKKYLVHGNTVCQFICLKDKNDIDIYNGDILKDLKGRFYKVFPVRGGFAINIHADDFHKESAPFYESTADQQTSGFISGSCEIIGNIHQNPELLNK